MSIVTEIQALSYACELDMNGTINVTTGKFFKASRDKVVRAKILCFN